MANKLTKQMKCSIGEQLVAAHLNAHGWPTVNVNSTINNFKGIDLLCQNGIDSEEVIGIQVKTTFQGINANISVGMNNKQATDIKYLKDNIKTPWVFVYVKRLIPLDAAFYILTAKQMIDLVYGLHQWYLYGWERRPCTPSLEKSMAGIRISHLQGKQDESRYSDTCFNNPMKGISTLNEWDNIWVKND